MTTYEKDQQMIADAVKLFPAEFGLSAWPGDRFKISRADSYVMTGSGTVMLYTAIKGADGMFRAFAKGGVSELLAAVTA